METNSTLQAQNDSARLRSSSYINLDIFIKLITVSKRTNPWFMEKRKPHYQLEKVQGVVADRNSRPFTMTALRGGLALGLTEPVMREVVLALRRVDFYKSMTTHRDHQLWQDVYHGVTPDGVPVYIKITGFDDDRPPVIQFKAK